MSNEYKDFGSKRWIRQKKNNDDKIQHENSGLCFEGAFCKNGCALFCFGSLLKLKTI